MIHYFDPAVDLKRHSKRKRNTKDSGGSHARDQVTPNRQSSPDSGDDDAVEPIDYPHAPLKRNVELPPELDASTVEQRNVKRQHLAVLNTILHKSLLDQDFCRAGRVFGMLLRVDFNGRRVDLRKNELWGIGAEILLRHDVQQSPGTYSMGAEGARSDSENAENIDLGPIWFSDKGFDAAKTYYDRLILQFPHRKGRPQDISAVHFYPAMFGLWIFQTQNRAIRAKAQLEKAHFDSDSSGSMSNGTGHENDSSRSKPQRPGLRKIETRELQDAKEIAERIDGLTLLPPFDRDVQLLKLKGMVALWLADLLHRNDPVTMMHVKEQRDKASDAFATAHRCGGEIDQSTRNSIESDQQSQLSYDL